MTVVIVRHRTELPAVDGMIAGMIGAERGAPVITVVTGGAGLGRFDGALHVLAHGELAGNGLFWSEWASGIFVDPPMQAAVVPRHPAQTVVVPINPAISAQAKAAERIAHHCTVQGRQLEDLHVKEEGGVFMVSDPGSRPPLCRWRRDRYGRPRRLEDARDTARAKTVKLLVVGDEELLRDTCPASLAAIGDAADALRIDADLAFWDPRHERPAALDTMVTDVDGILLPGGSDMEQVSGQIDVAQAAIRRDVPTVGLCLGMQTMATAVAREIVGFNDANMEEADPGAQTKTFVRLHDEHGLPQFRLGLRHPRMVLGTRLSEIFDGAERVAVHANHRYVLDPRLHVPLERAGMKVSGLQDERELAEAIEVPSLRFYIGMQGHPELMTRRGAPHPLVLAFLKQVAGE